MQRYLQYDTLVKNRLSHFDQWASTFGETVSAIELAPQGNGYRYKTRFSKFYNLPELMNMFKEVADIKTIDMMPEIVRPNANFETIVVKPSELQEEMVKSLGERAAKIQKGNVDPKSDNMLKITSDGRKIGLDQRLINDNLPDFEGSKVNACMNNVYRIWNETSDKKSTQILFCDFSTPNKDGRFNVYDDIKKKLIKKGIPENEIAFIHDYESETKKKELFGKVRQGKIRILFGSTFKLGAGTNVQDKLIAAHDLDCPWRPRDLEQRAGRILRQGNENKEVFIYRYVTESTFDSYLYQTIENKQKFISQIMSSKSPVRSCEDVDEAALSYAEIKALCAGNPAIREKMDLDIDVSRLKLLKSDYQNQHYRLEDNILKFFPKEIEKTKGYIMGYENDIKRIESNTNLPEEGISPMKVGNKVYTNRSEAGEAIIEACKQLKNSEPIKIGEYRGFDMQIDYDSFHNQFEMTLKGNMRYTTVLGSDEAGNITRINNALNEMPERLNALREKLENLYTQIKNAEEELKTPFQYEDELNDKIKRLALLDAQLNIDNNSLESAAENNSEIKNECAKAVKPSILQTIKENKQIIENKKNSPVKLSPDVTL